MEPVRAPRLGVWAEAALAFLVAGATFAVVSLALIALAADVPAVLLAVALVAAIAALARRAGVAYAVPVAMTTVLAYDWYYLPPTHAHDFPDAENVTGLLVYVALGVLIGQIAAHAGRRADVSDAVRGELSEEQAALRRVATLVAQGVPSLEVFTAVAREIGGQLGVDGAYIGRFDPGETVTAIAGWSPTGDQIAAGTQLGLDGESVTALVHRTGRPARVQRYDAAAGPIPAMLDERGVRASVGAPIVVDGRLWGVAVASSKSSVSLPPGTETRIGAFTELAGTAIANAEAQDELSRLADEQAALRRVATLVARGGGPEPVFQAVADEVVALFGSDVSAVLRFEPHGLGTIMGTHAGDPPTGTRLELDPDYVVVRVRTTGQAARFDTDDPAAAGTPAFARRHGICSALACPIVVEGVLWGAITIASYAPSLAAGTEQRLVDFTELVATAVANAQARSEVERLAAEQAALRRLATLVAEGATAARVFDAVAGEMASVLGADQVALNRFEPADEILVLAHRGLDVERAPVGSRLSVAGESATAEVRRTGRTARFEDYSAATGPLAELARASGLRFSVSAPIVVEGRLWGLITASWKGDDPPPADTEQRMAQFAELLDTAIANADSRGQLEASRARLVTAGDDARRRVVRDLHDGAQQRLVHTIVTLTLAKQALGVDGGKVRTLLTEALEQAQRSNEDLRELAHGILPSALTHGGLSAALDSVVTRMDLPVRLEVPRVRFRAEIEASAYFVVAEALTNVTKHAQARRADVRAAVDAGMLRLEVRDDGVGGADPAGHGLVGVNDRVSALGGRLVIVSPPGAGTLLTASLPLA